MYLFLECQEPIAMIREDWVAALERTDFALRGAPDNVATMRCAGPRTRHRDIHLSICDLNVSRTRLGFALADRYKAVTPVRWHGEAAAIGHNPGAQTAARLTSLPHQPMRVSRRDRPVPQTARSMSDRATIRPCGRHVGRCRAPCVLPPPRDRRGEWRWPTCGLRRNERPAETPACIRPTSADERDAAHSLCRM